MPTHTPFIRMLKSKGSSTSSDLTVDTYPSPTEDVLPVFCLDKLQPAIYHPVLLHNTLALSSHNETSSASNFSSTRSSEQHLSTMTGDNIPDKSIALKTASQIHLHSGSEDETVSFEERNDVPCLVDNVDSVDGVADQEWVGKGLNGVDDIHDNDDRSEGAPAVSSSSSFFKRQRANSQLRMPKGDSGRGSFALACKRFGGPWNEAEWSDGPSTAKGSGIPGKLAMIPKSELPQEFLSLLS